MPERADLARLVRPPPPAPPPARAPAPGSLTLCPPPTTQVEQLVPVCIGPVYQTAWKATAHAALSAYRATVLPGRPAMGIQALPADVDAAGHAGDDLASPTTAVRAARMVPADAVPDLAKLLVGSTRGIMHIIQDFRVKYPDVAKRQVEIKINEIAVKERRGGATAVRFGKPS